MMNAHVVAYYWFIFNRIEIERPSDALCLQKRP